MNRTDNIKLMILTPQETLFDGFVEKVDLPGDKGRFMVLRNHAPIISSLSAGEIIYVSAGAEARVAIAAGFVRVSDNEVVVCAEV